MIFIVHFHILDLPFKKEIFAETKADAESKFIEEFQEIPDYIEMKETT